VPPGETVDSGGGESHLPDSDLPAAAKLVTRLAHADLFWRACLCSLVVAATNPATVGRWAWDAAPTLRCLMQMVVCR
jgi:hypothetical protein